MIIYYMYITTIIGKTRKKKLSSFSGRINGIKKFLEHLFTVTLHLSGVLLFTHNTFHILLSTFLLLKKNAIQITIF